MAACLVTAGVAAPAPAPTYSESVDVELVTVEVVATDRAGRPITDLARDDLTLLFDGTPVAIEHFVPPVPARPAPVRSAVVEGPPADDPPADDATAHHAATSEPALLAIFVDQLHLVPPARGRLLAALSEAVAELVSDEGRRALVLAFDGALSVRAAPTDDPAAVRAALDALAAEGVRADGALAARRQAIDAIDRILELAEGPRPDPAAAQARRALGRIETYAAERGQQAAQAYRALDRAIGLLAGRGRPATLLYLGGALPLRPGGDLFAAWQQAVATAGLAFLDRDPFAGTAFDLGPAAQAVAERANAAGVTLYGLATETDPLAAAGAAARRGGKLDQASFLGVSAVMSGDTDRLGTLASLADATGGAVGHGDLRALLGRLASDRRGTYLLGTTRAPAAAGEGWRLQVAAARDGVRLRHRVALRRPTDEQAVHDLAHAALLLGGGANPLGVEVRLSEAPPPDDAADARGPLRLLVRLPIASLSLLPGPERHTGRVSVAVAARDRAGGLSPVVRRPLPIRIANGDLMRALGQVGRFALPLDLRSGAEHTLAVVVRDEVGGAASAVRVQYPPPSRIEAGIGTPADRPAARAAPSPRPRPRPPGSAARLELAPLPAVQAEAAALLVGDRESGDLPFAAYATVAASDTAGLSQSEVWLEVAAEAMQPAAAGAGAGDREGRQLEAYVYAFDPAGALVAQAGRRARLVWPDDGVLGTERVAFPVPIAAPAGSYRLRLLVRDPARGTIGLRSAPLELGDQAPNGEPVMLVAAPDPRPDPAVPTGSASAVGPVAEATVPAAMLAQVAPALHVALTADASGDDAAALAGLTAFEADVLSSAPEAVTRLLDAELAVCGELMATAPEAALPILDLYLRLYRRHREQRRPALAGHARRLATELAEVYRAAPVATAGPADGPSRDQLAAEVYAQLAAARSGGVGLDVERALALDPAYPEMLLAAAAQRDRHGLGEQAVLLLRRLLDLDPEHDEARLRLGMSLRRAGRMKQGERQLRAVAVTATIAWVRSLAWQELIRSAIAARRLGLARELLSEARTALPVDEKLLLLEALVADLDRSPAAARDLLARGLPVGARGGGPSSRHRYSRPVEAAITRPAPRWRRAVSAHRPTLAAALERMRQGTR